VIRASMPESRESVFRPASGGGLRMVIDASKLDSFVQPAITERSWRCRRGPRKFVCPGDALGGNRS